MGEAPVVDPTVLTMLEELDAERPKSGQRCRVCRDLSPVQRSFVKLAKERGHSNAAIARKLRATFDGCLIGEWSVKNHLDGDHDVAR